MNKPLRLLLIASAVMIADGASTAQVATQVAAIDQCQLYGFARGSRDYAECRMDVRRYWTTGPCGSAGFAAMHRGYCHLNPPPLSDRLLCPIALRDGAQERGDPTEPRQ